ncbi:uncharacterized protein LOC105287685 isoform X2 [Ooceraea biroi]|uniref:uncharacterized protein LOC105287685 isoform X2 n=1 Tax=Ooceraea biroi TaxID=2015173 RepID=UPI0005B92918|nr:uncharacterized protein LOC105287685 isoform X2 [Ooceraea biroi]
MFQPSLELDDSVPSWWEAECVRYGLSHAPVRHRLTAIMGRSHVVRLTDRSYMMRLTSRLQEDREARQRTRIEARKLRRTAIVPELRGSLPGKICIKIREQF